MRVSRLLQGTRGPDRLRGARQLRCRDAAAFPVIVLLSLLLAPNRRSPQIKPNALSVVAKSLGSVIALKSDTAEQRARVALQVRRSCRSRAGLPTLTAGTAASKPPIYLKSVSVAPAGQLDMAHHGDETDKPFAIHTAAMRRPCCSFMASCCFLVAWLVLLVLLSATGNSVLEITTDGTYDAQLSSVQCCAERHSPREPAGARGEQE